MEVVLGVLQLLPQNLRELDQLLALQVGIHRDVALCHGIDDSRDAHRIGAPQLDAQEVPV